MLLAHWCSQAEPSSSPSPTQPPRQVILTDHHPSVLKQLSENVAQNHEYTLSQSALTDDLIHRAPRHSPSTVLNAHDYDTITDNRSADLIVTHPNRTNDSAALEKSDDQVTCIEEISEGPSTALRSAGATSIRCGQDIEGPPERYEIQQDTCKRWKLLHYSVTLPILSMYRML